MLDKLKEIGWEIFHSAKEYQGKVGSKVFVGTTEKTDYVTYIGWSVRAYHKERNIYWGSYDECSDIPSEGDICSSCLETLWELSETLGIIKEDKGSLVRELGLLGTSIRYFDTTGSLIIFKPCQFSLTIRVTEDDNFTLESEGVYEYAELKNLLEVIDKYKNEILQIFVDEKISLEEN